MDIPKRSLKTLEIVANHGEMIKAAEAIDIVGVEKLTLQDQRIWNYLLENAHGAGLGEYDREFKIDLTPLKSNHESNDRLEESIERLMQTVARVRLQNGSVVRFQLLGGNNIGDPLRPRGEMTYSFDKRLIEVLRSSGTFGKLELAVMDAFSSKYALALYEHMSRKVNLRKWMEEYTIDELRDILRVGEGQLKSFGNLKQRALVPAIEEVNQWAHFKLAVSYKKRSQRIVGVVFNWSPKKGSKIQEIRDELAKSKVGRKARINRTVETIHVLGDRDAFLQDDEPEGEIIDKGDLLDMDDSALPLE